jgi:CxxC-x17-CxxC domain-containing protein
MGNFRQDGGKRFGGNRGGGFNRRDNGRGRFGGGDRDRGPVTMHQAICAQCGKSCEVPFEPTSGRPVYCNDCFGGKKETGNSRGGDRFPQKNYDNYKAPMRPDFRGDAGKGNDYELKKQLEMLNTKMDRLIKAAEIMAKIGPSAAEGKVKEVTKTAPATKAKKSVKKTSKK